MRRYTARPSWDNKCEIHDQFTGKVQTILTESDAEAEALANRVDDMNDEFQKTVEAVDSLMRRLNILGGNERNDDIVLALRREHRTLQQNFTRLCVAWLDSLAKLEPNEYDLRMEGSVKLAKALQASDVWERCKYLPTI